MQPHALLHCVSLRGTFTSSLHCIITTPRHIAALYSLHCTTTTRVHFADCNLTTRLIFPTIPLHCTPLLLYIGLTTFQQHCSTALQCTLNTLLLFIHSHYSTAHHCSVQGSTTHFISTGSNSPYCIVQCYTLLCISQQFTSTELHCWFSITHALYFTSLQCTVQ